MTGRGSGPCAIICSPAKCITKERGGQQRSQTSVGDLPCADLLQDITGQRAWPTSTLHPTGSFSVGSLYSELLVLPELCVQVSLLQGKGLPAVPSAEWLGGLRTNTEETPLKITQVNCHSQKMQPCCRAPLIRGHVLKPQGTCGTGQHQPLLSRFTFISSSSLT